MTTQLTPSSAIPPAAPLTVGLGAPLDPALAEAFTVLADVVTALDRPEHPPTASEVRVEMARRTWGGFEPAKFGFGRFRDFLEAASTRSVITVDWDRAGDVTMTVPPEAGHRSAPPIRRDLYRAFVDWSGDKVRLLNRNCDAVCELPRDRAPLEPEAITELRRTWVERPNEYVQIPRIAMADQLAWMHDFADSRRDTFLAEELRTALAGPKPARDFTNILRRHPADLLSWRRLMQDRVRVRVEEWRDHHVPGLHIDQQPTASGPTPDGVDPAQAAEEQLTAAARELKPVRTGHDAGASGVPRAAAGRPSHPRPAAHAQVELPAREQEVRRRLHRAIDRMSLTELLSLSIPVGYLLED